MKKILTVLFLSFIFTSTALAQSASFTINLGTAETTDNKALLYITAPSDTAYMVMSNRSDFSGSAKVAFTPATIWDLCSGLIVCTSGSHDIYIKIISKTGKEQIISNSVKYTSKSTVASVPIYKSFSRTLKLGSEGQDVKDLQIYLNNHGFLITSTGPGSKGQESIYFGPRTSAALKLFQESNASVILDPLGLSSGSGIAGIRTLEFIRNNP